MFSTSDFLVPDTAGIPKTATGPTGTGAIFFIVLEIRNLKKFPAANVKSAGYYRCQHADLNKIAVYYKQNKNFPIAF